MFIIDQNVKEEGMLLATQASSTKFWGSFKMEFTWNSLIFQNYQNLVLLVTYVTIKR